MITSRSNYSHREKFLQKFSQFHEKKFEFRAFFVIKKVAFKFFFVNLKIIAKIRHAQIAVYAITVRSIVSRLTFYNREFTSVENQLQDRERRRHRDCQSSPLSDQLSPENNETLERRNLKSILKKLSAGSKPTSSETSATSTPERSAVAYAELKKLMRAPTLEGYAARHSKLSKSVTFNKYTLQSPPSASQSTDEDGGPAHHAKPTSLAIALPASAEIAATEPVPATQQQVVADLEARPSTSGVMVAQRSPRSLDDEECVGDLVVGIKEFLQSKMVRNCLKHFLVKNASKPNLKQFNHDLLNYVVLKKCLKVSQELSWGFL